MAALFAPFRAVQIIVIAAVFLQFSDLTRYLYVGLGVAPDCPVVGQTTAGDCCPSPDLAAASALSPSIVGVTGDAEEPPCHASPPSKKRPDECTTCKKLAIASKFIDLGLPSVKSVDSPDRFSTGPSQSRLSHLDLHSPRASRAPPLSA